MDQERSTFRRIRARARARATAEAARLAGLSHDIGKLYETLTAMMHSIDRTARIVRVSDTWLERLGYLRREVLGRKAAEFLSESTRDHAAEKILPLFFTGAEVRDIPLEYLCAGGEIVYAQVSATSVRDVTGNVVEGLAISRDVTDGRRAEERLRKVIASAECLLWSASVFVEEGRPPQWEIDAVDEDAAQSFFPVERLPFESWTDAWQRSKLPEDAQRSAQVAWDAFTGGARQYVHEFRCRRIDGELCWFSEDVHIEPQGDRRWRAVGVCVEITARRRADDELRRAKKIAEDASRAKSTFLANMSHEIRTPMTAILGYVDMLQDSKLPENQRAAFLRTIRRNGDQLLGVINDLLDLSKIEAGKLTVEPAACDLVAVIEDVRAALSPKLGEKRLSLRVLYETAIPVTLRTDPARLRGILVNLVGNAVKFTERGGVKIRIRANRLEQRIAIVVEDTGIGIPDDSLERIFEPFMQADASSTRAFGGMGLGLTISRTLTRLLGGDLTVASRLGAGSEFTVEIDPGPLDAADWITPASDEKPTATEIPAPNFIDTLGGRVLLVEDSPDNQAIISHLLTKSGVTVTLAENGQIGADTALAALHAGHPFDLILMDMQMPVLDGYQSAATLRANGYRHPIVALTANAMTGDREKCLQAGCDDYATKPIHAETLLELVRRYATGAAPAIAHPPAELHPSTDSKIEQLLQRFLDGLPRRIDVMRKSLITQDYETLKRLVHQLKGAAGSYGFPNLTTAAGTLEQTMRVHENVSCISEELAKLAAMCDQTVAARKR